MDSPGFDEILKITGVSRRRFLKLVEFLRTNYEPQEVVRFSKRDGYTIFFRKSGKPLLYVNVIPGGFVVTVVIGASLEDKVVESGVSKKTTELFKSARQYHDGRWLNFDVKTDKQIEDIKKLVLLKKNPVKKTSD